MTGRLEDKVALIVGSARGIGKGIALRFAEEGAKLVLADTEAEAGASDRGRTRRRLSSAPTSRRWPTPRPPSRWRSKHHGRLDIIVQNAGIYPWQLIENTSADDWDRVMAVNLRGTFNAARAALVPMKAQRYGRMLFTSSITGPHVTSPGHGHYSATKAGINGFIRAAALEFSGYGITVNGVEPGNILTEAIAAASRRRPSSRTWKTPSRSAASAARATSPMPSCSSPRTMPATSPARPSSSTAANLLPEGNDFRLLPP